MGVLQWDIAMEYALYVCPITEIGEDIHTHRWSTVCLRYLLQRLFKLPATALSLVLCCCCLAFQTHTTKAVDESRVWDFALPSKQRVSPLTWPGVINTSHL